MKDLYIAIFEEHVEEMVDRGVDEERACEIAAETAYEGMADHLAGIADSRPEGWKPSKEWE